MSGFAGLMLQNLGWTPSEFGNWLSNLSAKMSFSQTTPNWWGGNHQLLSKWSWILVTIPTNVALRLSLGGHQCGACHNASDVKVSVQKLFGEIREFWVLELPLLVYFRCIYSFLVSSRWGLNCGFSAPSVTPQDLLMWVLKSCQWFDS